MIYGRIYKFQNMLNNKVYIGKTTQKDLERVKQHLLYNHHSKLYEGIINDGLRNFSFEFIDEAETPEELDAKELQKIEYYDSINTGYNTQHSNSHKFVINLDKNKLTLSSFTTNKKVRKKDETNLDLDKIKNIFKYVFDNYPKRLLMFILNYNGFKVRDLVNVKVKDVIENNNIKNIVNITGKKIHLLFETQVFLKNYIMINKLDSESYLFKSKKTGGIYEKNSVTNFFHKVYEELGFKKESTNLGRRTYFMYRDINKLNDYSNAIFSFNKRIS